MYSGSIGLIVVIVITVSSVIMGGAKYFLNIPAILISIGLPLGLCILSYGIDDCKSAFRTLRVLLLKPKNEDCTSRNIMVIKGAIAYSYVAGFIGALIPVIQMLTLLNDWSVFPLGLGLSLLSFFYSCVIAELILRPTMRRIEGYIYLNSFPHKPENTQQSGAAYVAQSAPSADP